MKPDLFIFDRRLYRLFQQGHLRQFTTNELRNAYATDLAEIAFNSSDLRRYVYEQIRRMLRTGWVIQDEKRQKRGQIYHWQNIPANLQVELIDNGYENSAQSLNKPTQQPAPRPDSDQPGPAVVEHLESILKEIRLDFLSSMGETERYKQLLDEMPNLKDQVEDDYLEARDRSSRLLGHLRAVEKTLKTIMSAR